MNYQRSFSDYVFLILNILCLAVTGIFLLIRHGKLPDSVPSNYDLYGNVTGTSSPYIIYVLFGIMVFTFLLLLLMGRHPEYCNLPVRITEENAVRIYRDAALMLGSVTLIINLFLAYGCITMMFGRAMNNIVAYVFVISLVADTLIWIILMRLHK